jgi:hypothetical protein
VVAVIEGDVRAGTQVTVAGSALPPTCRYVPGNNRERASYSLFSSGRYSPLLETFPTSLLTG